MKGFIKDALKTSQQIYAELEYEEDDNQFKLFTVPITFEFLTRVFVLIAPYITTQIIKITKDKSWS